MSSYNLPVLATVVLLLPMIYFGIASLTFFLRTFDDPMVTWMLRGLIGISFLAVSTCCVLGAMVFALYGHVGVALGTALVAGCAAVARGWLLRRMDDQFRARETGDGEATRRLRRLHVAGIAYNTIQLVAVIAIIPVTSFVGGT
jgi:hypothetical protein